MPTHTTFDPSAFETLKASVSGDASFLINLITDYLDDAAHHIKTMRQAAEEGNTKLLERTAHTLKSTSETMGAAALAAVSRKIETLAHDGRFDEATAYVPVAAERLAAVRTALRDQQAALEETR